MKTYAHHGLPNKCFTLTAAHKKTCRHIQPIHTRSRHNRYYSNRNKQIIIILYIQDPDIYRYINETSVCVCTEHKVKEIGKNIDHNSNDACEWERTYEVSLNRELCWYDILHQLHQWNGCRHNRKIFMRTK